MIGLLCFALAVLTSPFKSKLRLEAENAALHHQLIVLRRKLRGRVRLANSDRWFLVRLYRWFPSILQALAIIRPTLGTALNGAHGSLVLNASGAFTDSPWVASTAPTGNPNNPRLAGVLDGICI